MLPIPWLERPSITRPHLLMGVCESQPAHFAMTPTREVQFHVCQRHGPDSVSLDSPCVNHSILSYAQPDGLLAITRSQQLAFPCLSSARLNAGWDLCVYVACMHASHATVWLRSLYASA